MIFAKLTITKQIIEMLKIVLVGTFMGVCLLALYKFIVWLDNKGYPAFGKGQLVKENILIDGIAIIICFMIVLWHLW